MSSIGFVGLGHMGLPMASNLLRKGHEVVGYDLQPAAMEALVKAGGRKASDLQEAARENDLIICMLQKGSQVLDAAESLLKAAKKDALFIDCSTIDVQSAQRLHEMAKAKQLQVLDAPVSGGVASAAAGTLTFMVGGEESAFERAKPFLQCMGKTLIHTGEAGSGQAAKICNNLILGISMVAVSEGFILADALGLSPNKLFEVVNHASGQCWVMSNYVPVPGILDKVPANANYQPGFASAMMLKDLLLSHEAAASSNIDLPLGHITTELYQRFVDQGFGNLDFSAIIRELSNPVHEQEV